MIVIEKNEKIDYGVALHFHNVGKKSIKGKYLMDDFPTVVINVGNGVSFFFQNLEQYSSFTNQLYAYKKKLEYQVKEKSKK